MYKFKLGHKRLFNNPQKVRTRRGIKRTQKFVFKKNRRKMPKDRGM